MNEKDVIARANVMAWFGCVSSTCRANNADAPPEDKSSEDLHNLSDGDSDGDEMESSKRRPHYKEFKKEFGVE